MPFEMLEPTGYGSAHKHLSLGSFRTLMLRIPGPWTMANFIADASRMTITNPASLSHSACACWLQDGLGPPQASRQARLWGVLLTAHVPKAPKHALSTLP